MGSPTPALHLVHDELDEYDAHVKQARFHLEAADALRKNLMFRLSKWDGIEASESRMRNMHDLRRLTDASG